MDFLNSPKVGDIKIDGNIEKAVWRKIRPLELVSSITGRRTKVKTEVRFCHSEKHFYLAYNVFDEHIFATYKKHDDPLWKEEAVEVFIGPGKSWPKNYFEFQFSSLGVSFDAAVENPTGNRRNHGFKVDPSWNCKGLKVASKIFFERVPTAIGTNREVLKHQIENSSRHPARGGIPRTIKTGRWTVEAAILWKEILAKGKKLSEVPFFRLNFLRIDGYPEQSHFLSYAPTLKNPADFHVPQKFALLKLES